MRNEKYKGVYVFNRSAAKDCRGKRNNHQNKFDDEVIRIEGGIPAIVDSETFDTVARIIASRKKLCPNRAAKENYLLSGKMFCGQCGNTYIGNRKFNGRNRKMSVVYRCNKRSRMTSDGCDNKEIRREYIESFVIKELVKIIFDDDRIPILIEKYKEFNKQSAKAANLKIKHLEKKITDLDGKLANIITAIASTGSSALINALESLEKEKTMLQEQMENEQARLVEINITEEQIRSAYKQARELYLSGSLDEMRQLINLYLNKVVINKEHVEVFLNVLPVYMQVNSTSENNDVRKIGGGGGN